jgi:putative SOS response-associated peptidase YedK
MCGRYLLRQKPLRAELKESPAIWARYWNVISIDKPHYNIGPHPHLTASVITNSGCQSMLFGMKPSWAKTTLINAKSEGLKHSKFWKPLAAMRPCLVPADGFYEPLYKPKDNTIHENQESKKSSHEKSGKQKKPWYGFEFEDHSQFFMAGMWKHLEGHDRFVILTREPSGIVEPIHNRMPVIFTVKETENAQNWLNTKLNFDDRLLQTQAPIEFPALRSFPVSDAAKNLGKNDASLFHPLEA